MVEHQATVTAIGSAWFAVCSSCGWEVAPYYTRAEAERVAEEHERHPNLSTVLPRTRRVASNRVSAFIPALRSEHRHCDRCLELNVPVPRWATWKRLELLKSMEMVPWQIWMYLCPRHKEQAEKRERVSA